MLPVRGGRVMAVDVTLEPTVAFSPPREVLDFAKVGAFSDDFSMLPDGRFVVIQKGENEGDVTQLNVVLNWFEELKAKVAAK